VASDIRRGRTRDPIDRYGTEEVFVRAAPHPSVFWIVVALKGGLAAILIGAALGELLGLWNLS
jgi:hypothetical protein